MEENKRREALHHENYLAWEEAAKRRCAGRRLVIFMSAVILALVLAIWQKQFRASETAEPESAAAAEK
jgi:hypothetical protein